MERAASRSAAAAPRAGSSTWSATRMKRTRGYRPHLRTCTPRCSGFSGFSGSAVQRARGLAAEAQPHELEVRSARHELEADISQERAVGSGDKFKQVGSRHNIEVGSSSGLERSFMGTHPRAASSTAVKSEPRSTRRRPRSRPAARGQEGTGQGLESWPQGRATGGCRQASSPRV